MDVRGIQPHRGVDRSANGGARPTRENATRNATDAPGRSDSAAISAAGRETLAAVDALTERAKGDDPGRREIVEAAKARLASGELDSIATARETARKMLG